MCGAASACASASELLLHGQLRAGGVLLGAVRPVDALPVRAAQASPAPAATRGADRRTTSSPASPARPGPRAVPGAARRVLVRRRPRDRAGPRRCSGSGHSAGPGRLCFLQVAPARRPWPRALARASSPARCAAPRCSAAAIVPCRVARARSCARGRAACRVPARVTWLPVAQQPGEIQRALGLAFARCVPALAHWRMLHSARWSGCVPAVAQLVRLDQPGQDRVDRRAPGGERVDRLLLHAGDDPARGCGPVRPAEPVTAGSARFPARARPATAPAPWVRCSARESIARHLPSRTVLTRFSHKMCTCSCGSPSRLVCCGKMATGISCASSNRPASTPSTRLPW